MKQVFTILGFVAALLTTILAVLPNSNIAIFSAIAAFIFSFIAFYLSKKAGNVKKIIQFSLLLTIIALSLTMYKALTKAEVVDTEELIINEETFEQGESFKELKNSNLENLDIEK